MESQLMISPLSSLASFTEEVLFPTPVGPRMTMIFLLLDCNFYQKINHEECYED